MNDTIPAITLPAGRALSKAKITQIFDDAKMQTDYVVGLYKLALGAQNWDACQTVHGHPIVSRETSLYIYEKAIAWDKEHCPDVLNGGAWMNNGFSTDENMTRNFYANLRNVVMDVRS